MNEHTHRDVKHYPNDDYGTHGTQVEECACSARRQTHHETGKWSEWQKKTQSEGQEEK